LRSVPLHAFYDDLPAYQTLCTTCHYQSSTYQQVTNYPYAKNFGGATETWYPDIYTQFSSPNSLYTNCGSRHNLGEVQNVLMGQTWGFNDDPNPCVACHNPHAAQQNHDPVEIDEEGKLNTAIRRPSHYKSTDPLDSLWGDDANERMDAYASSQGGTYQAPYYTADTTFEPANNDISDGSNLPDYVTFCMDCHQYEQIDPDRGGATVKAIIWEGAGADIHGAAIDACNPAFALFKGTLKPPYEPDNPTKNYILSCLDCHEPHGNYKRLHLIRLRINGATVGTTSPPCDGSYGENWPPVCLCCHDIVSDHWTMSCPSCHSNPVAGGFHGGKIDGAGVCAGEPAF
jgi:hypothetical protein